MDLVNEENRRIAAEESSALGTLNDVAHVFHAARHGAQRIERSLQLIGYDLRQRGLSHTRRSPQDE